MKKALIALLTLPLLLAAQSWEELPKVPITQRIGTATFVVNNELYVGSGSMGQSYRPESDFYKYDNNLREWVQIDDIPSAHETYLNLPLSGDTMGYLCGGLYYSSKRSDIWAYSSKTEEWIYEATIPYGPRGYLAGSIVKDTLYIIGGTANEDSLERQNLGYDLKSRTWSIKAKSPVLTMSGSSVVYNDEIYMLFGHDTLPETSNAADTLMWIYNPQKDEWRQGPAIPFGNRIHGSATILNGVIYLIGGAGASAMEKDAWAYDIEKDEWNKLPDLPTVMGVWMGNAVTIGKSIYYSCSGTYVDSAFCKVFKYTPGKMGVSMKETSFSEYVTISQNWVTLSPKVTSVQVYNWEGKLLNRHQNQFYLEAGTYLIQAVLESGIIQSSKVIIK